MDVFFLWVAFVQTEVGNTASIDAPRTTYPAVDIILNDYANVFMPPKSLPSCRPIDHEIVIHPGFGLVKIHLYKYTWLQKEEMGGLVSTMLEEGIIRPSRLPIDRWSSWLEKKMGLGVSALIIGA